MKLSYRGISYELKSPVAETTDTEQMGLFLGKSFKIKQSNVTERHSPPAQLKYRGIDYEH